MFGRVKGMFKASEASGIIKSAFRALPLPMLPFDPDTLATSLVAQSYSAKPEMFDGKHGKPPHALATAAVSLAGGLTYEGYEFGASARQCVFLALGNVLLDASTNRGRYGFGMLDIRLLELAENAYLKHADETQTATSEAVRSLGL